MIFIFKFTKRKGDFKNMNTQTEATTIEMMEKLIQTNIQIQEELERVKANNEELKRLEAECMEAYKKRCNLIATEQIQDFAYVLKTTERWEALNTRISTLQREIATCDEPDVLKDLFDTVITVLLKRQSMLLLQTYLGALSNGRNYPETMDWILENLFDEKEKCLKEDADCNLFVDGSMLID